MSFGEQASSGVGKGKEVVDKVKVLGLRRCSLTAHLLALKLQARAWI
jgi:hypothetical protein